MNAGDDRDVRAAFKALGRRVTASASSFHELASAEALHSARTKRRRRRAGATLIAASVVLALVVLPREPAGDAFDYERFTALTGIDLGEVTWEAPSDVLLDVPGRDLLQRVPMIEIQWPTVLPDSARPAVTNDSQRRIRS